MSHCQNKLFIASKASRSRYLWLVPSYVIALGLVSDGALAADSKFDPTLGVRYVYFSNVYALPSDGSTISSPSGRSARADHALTYFAGFVGDYGFGRQQLEASVRFNHLAYQIFTQLDHNEYTADVILKWKLGHVFDGTLGYTQEQSMVAFTDLNNTTTIPNSTLLMETSKVSSVTANMQMTPVWRLETGASVRALDSERPANTKVLLDENTERLALRNVGISRLSFGLDTIFVDGKYKGNAVTQNPDYKQTSYQLAADYVVSGLSSLNSAIGYTKRTQSAVVGVTQNGDVSAVTGKLGYTRKISAKTGIDLQLSRQVNSYLTTVSSEVDSTATLGFNWQITAKTKTAFSYGIGSSDFPNEKFVTSTGTDTRVDHAQFVTFEVDYLPLRALTIKPYIRYDVRTSNIALLQYHGKTIGIEMSGTW